MVSTGYQSEKSIQLHTATNLYNRIQSYGVMYEIYQSSESVRRLSVVWLLANRESKLYPSMFEKELKPLS